MNVGMYEAKTHFSSIMVRVENGEEFVVTRHGVPVARIVPIETPKSREDIRQVIAEMREARKGRRLGGLKIKDLIEEGRA